VDAVHQRRVATHFRRQRAKKMTNSLLVLHVNLEIAYHHHAAIGADAFLSPAEFAGLHVALHNVDTVLLGEGNAGNFITEASIYEWPWWSGPVRDIETRPKIRPNEHTKPSMCSGNQRINRHKAALHVWQMLPI
jgi:hypothetical protein